MMRPWKEHIRVTLHALMQGYQSGLETGDFEFAGFNMMMLSFHSYHAGEPLLQLCDDIAKYCELVEKQKQTSALFISQQYHALSEAGLFLYSVEFLPIGEKRGA